MVRRRHVILNVTKIIHTEIKLSFRQCYGNIQHRRRSLEPVNSRRLYHANCSMIFSTLSALYRARYHGYSDEIQCCSRGCYAYPPGDYLHAFEKAMRANLLAPMTQRAEFLALLNRAERFLAFMKR